MIKPSETEIADALVGGAEFIRDNGWIQGDFYQRGRGACAMGALRRHLKLDSDQNPQMFDLDVRRELSDEEYRATRESFQRRSEVYSFAKRALRKCLDARNLVDHSEGIADWNDRGGQQAEAVLEVMSDCAARTREGNDTTEAAS